MCTELEHAIEAVEKLRTVVWANQPSSTHGDNAVALVNLGTLVEVWASIAGWFDVLTLDENGIPLNYSDRRRFAVGRQRDAAIIAFPTCDQPGCDIRSVHCEIDHLLAWIDGGLTDIANLRPRCKGHNLWKEHVTAQARRRTQP